MGIISENNHIAEIHYRIIDNLMETLPKSTHILDAGCGKAELAKKLAKNGFRVSACDLYQIKNKINRVNYKKVDLNVRLPYKKDTFDVIICLEVVEHLKNPWHLMAEFYRILNKNGSCIISTPNSSNALSRLFTLLTGQIWLFREYTTDHINAIPYWELQRILLDTGFNSVELIDGANVTTNPHATTNIRSKFIQFIYISIFISWDALHTLYTRKNKSAISLFRSFSYIVRAKKNEK